jgi:RNA polymerase II subunit A-like phosphatase
LINSIALLGRQDETPYLLDDPPVIVGPGSSPTADYHQISSDPDPDTDDWDEPVGAGGTETKPLTLDEINWADINDEVEAAMNESEDDGDARSENSGMRSVDASEDEETWSDNKNSSTR